MTSATPDWIRRGFPPGPWSILSGVVALLVLLPILALAGAATGGSAAHWRELLAYVLPAATLDTLILLAGVGVLTALIGGGTAWLVTCYDFPGRAIIDRALLLPLAVPTYIVAYAYLDILHPVGPVQTVLRDLLGFESPREFRLPDIRSMAGCVVLLAFVLYPYVYLPVRAMFMMQSASMLEAARTLGVGGAALFFRVGLPLARPAVAAGVALALMEALNDIGASEFLGVRTMTVAIYTTWVTRSDLAGAAQIALAMLAVVLILVVVERRARNQRGYASEAQHPRPPVRERLTGIGSFAATMAGALPIAIGFAAPASYLVDAAMARARTNGVTPAIIAETLNTIGVAAAATALMMAFAVALVYGLRLSSTPAAAVLVRASSIGYAVPGTVLAIGLLPVVTGFDRVINWITVGLSGSTMGLVTLGSGAALIYAYVARFLAVAVGGVEAGFSRVSSSMDDAARTLGDSAVRRLVRVHLPLIRPALAASTLLVLVDCMKELPATLLLRPIGFETLATHLYGEAARGTYEDASIAALLIVVAGLLPVFGLIRLERERTPTS